MPTLARLAHRILTSFSTMYRGEQGFSTVLEMQTRKTNLLELSSDARISPSQTKPKIEKLAQEKRAQPSH